MSTHDASLTISELRKSYAGHTAVDGVNLEIRPQEFLTLLGPSGCGKTTLLRCIAGLERIDGGRIALDDRVLSDAATGDFLRPEKRNVGMVFQNYALWPHMTVEQNVMYPLKMRGVDRRSARTTALEVLELVELARFATRPVGNLSGGQQQRVALARAVVAEPDLMLFDEPLSNLDASLRESMRAYILSAHRAAGCLSVYVTHDQSEALSLSDRIAVMFEGRVRQVGTPEQVYRRPIDRRVARFLGFDNFIEGTVAKSDGVHVEIRASSGATLVASATSAVPIGETVQVAVRSSHIELGRDDGTATAANSWPATVTSVRDAQSVIDYDVQSASIRLGVRVLDIARGHAATRPAAGETIRIRIDPEQAVVLRDEERSAAVTA